MQVRNNPLRILGYMFRSLVLTAHICIIVLFIFSAFSDRFSPESSMIFPYLGLGFPAFCFFNLCFTLYWLFTCEWRFIWIGLLAFMVCFGQIKLYFPFNPRTEEISGENTVKLLTYNVMSFGYKPHSDSNHNPTIDYLANSGADIICLQEYAEDSQNKYLTKPKIFQALKMYPYHSVVYLNKVGRLRFGIALFSKYPILKSEQIYYKSQYNGSAKHVVKINGKDVTIINNHLESFKLTQEDRSRYSAFVKDMDTENFEELKSSLKQKLGTAFMARAKQARIIAKERDSVKTEYLIICGDFNDTPISYAHRTIQGRLLDSFAESGRGMGISYNENSFWFRIDHILHSDNIRSFNCTVDKVHYSDHYPMWCYLQLQN